MESSKVLSVRVDRVLYDKILIECNKNNITVTEWLERKIAIANRNREVKREILKRVDSIYSADDFDSNFNKLRFISLKRYISDEL
ncbi:MAG: hypothetical protein WCG74_07300 [Sediminibacterium sp.]|jgi:hypothetical protein